MARMEMSPRSSFIGMEPRSREPATGVLVHGKIRATRFGELLNRNINTCFDGPTANGRLRRNQSRKSLADLRPNQTFLLLFESAPSNVVYTQPLLSMALGTRNVRRDVLGWWTVQTQPNQASSVS